MSGAGAEEHKTSVKTRPRHPEQSHTGTEERSIGTKVLFISSLAKYGSLLVVLELHRSSNDGIYPKRMELDLPFVEKLWQMGAS